MYLFFDHFYQMADLQRAFSHWTEPKNFLLTGRLTIVLAIMVFAID
jgi:hypothetical protein